MATKDSVVVTEDYTLSEGCVDSLNAVEIVGCSAPGGSDSSGCDDLFLLLKSVLFTQNVPNF